MAAPEEQYRPTAAAPPNLPSQRLPPKYKPRQASAAYKSGASRIRPSAWNATARYG